MTRLQKWVFMYSRSSCPGFCNVAILPRALQSHRRVGRGIYWSSHRLSDSFSMLFNATGTLSRGLSETQLWDARARMEEDKGDLGSWSRGGDAEVMRR